MSILINDGINLFLSARETLPPLGKYESEDEGILLMNIIIRHVESITHLANYDLVLLPSAFILARSILEASTKIKWMLYPKDPMEREARWLVHLKGEEEYLLNNLGSAEPSRPVPPPSTSAIMCDSPPSLGMSDARRP
jgi:hypothetical protein